MVQENDISVVATMSALAAIHGENVHDVGGYHHLLPCTIRGGFPSSIGDLHPSSSRTDKTSMFLRACLRSVTGSLCSLLSEQRSWTYIRPTGGLTA